MTAGALVREWRERRRLTQLELSLDAEISTRHLSFIETGRSKPSRDMVLRLAERLHVPLRERNMLLVAAGFAPIYGERQRDDPAIQRAIELVLRGHEPYPALAIDRQWTLVAMNSAVAPFFAGIDPALLEPPVNVLRLSVDPRGLAPRIDNFDEWHAHLVERVRQQVEQTADPFLIDLLRDLGKPRRTVETREYAGLIIPIRLRTDAGVLAFFSTTTMFGTPVDITLSEIAIESFFPADEATRALYER